MACMSGTGSQAARVSETASRTARMSDAALLVRNLRKAYSDVIAVNGLDLEVHRGECFGLLGPNGAGKTTTIEICEGLTTPDSGEVEVLGMRWETQAMALRQRLGIQLQETQLSDKLTVFETVRLFRSFYHQGPSADEVIELMHLGEKSKSRVGGLSGGQKQRLALACALAGDPELLFLDEPTTGLDPQARRQLWDVIEEFRAQGRTILLTTHYMDEADNLCDRIAIVDHGKLVALDTPTKLKDGVPGNDVVEAEFVDPPSGWNKELEKLPQVVSVAERDGNVHISSQSGPDTVGALMDLARDRKVTVKRVTVQSTTLDDVFLHYTGRALRDEVGSSKLDISHLYNR